MAHSLVDYPLRTSRRHGPLRDLLRPRLPRRDGGPCDSRRRSAPASDRDGRRPRTGSARPRRDALMTRGIRPSTTRTADLKQANRNCSRQSARPASPSLRPSARSERIVMTRSVSASGSPRSMLKPVTPSTLISWPASSRGRDHGHRVAHGLDIDEAEALAAARHGHEVDPAPEFLDLRLRHEAEDVDRAGDGRLGDHLAQARQADSGSGDGEPCVRHRGDDAAPPADEFDVDPCSSGLRRDDRG